MLSQYLSVQPTEAKGRGVFTAVALPARTTVEESPVIVMTEEDRVHLDRTLLHDYIFEWGLQQEKCCMALGLVPIYNHSYESNCDYFMDFENNTISIQTMKAVAAGEELTINYNGDWKDETKIWFDVKE